VSSTTEAAALKCAVAERRIGVDIAEIVPVESLRFFAFLSLIIKKKNFLLKKSTRGFII